MAPTSVDVPGLDNAIKAQIYEHIFSNDDHEVGGVLVGTLGDKALPTVTGAIAALEARGERASVTFTHDAWATVHATLERDFPDRQIVGWYHSHPGFGIFLSRHDLFIHENFFSDPRQVAYVVDPRAGAEGVFSWRDGRIVELFTRDTTRPGTGMQRRAPDPLPRVEPLPAAPPAPQPSPPASWAAADDVVLRPATGSAPPPSPGPARAEAPWSSAEPARAAVPWSTARPSDPVFVRRAVLVAAFLGAICGVATQLLVG